MFEIKPNNPPTLVAPVTVPTVPPVVLKEAPVLMLPPLNAPINPPTLVEPLILPVLLEREPVIVPALKPPMTPPTVEFTATVPTLPELVKLPESVPLVMLPNNPPTLLPPVLDVLIAPELVSVPLKVCPLTEPIMPPMPVVLLSLMAPVLVKLFAKVNEVVVVPKIPPMELIAAELVTASAFVNVLVFPTNAFDVRLPINPPILAAPEMLFVETCVVDKGPLIVPPVTDPIKPPTLVELASVPTVPVFDREAYKLPAARIPMIPPTFVAPVTGFALVLLLVKVLVASVPS